MPRQVEETFCNPYRLLRQPGNAPDKRYKPDLSTLKGYVGRLECLLEVHTPLEINYKQDMQFNREPRIPGSSLKGVIRSMVEFVGMGCLSVRNKSANEGHWQLCNNAVACPACDMFGRVAGKTVNKGKVLIGEAVPSERGYGRHKTIDLYQGSPKEKHDAFYPLPNGRDCYRKFYHHHQNAAAGLRINHSGMKHASALHPVEAGSEFVFSVTFAGLDEKQLALLYYSLALEPGLLHKMGRGKGHGLGSVKIKIKKVFVQEAGDRYRGKEVSHILPAPVENELEKLKNAEDLDELRKMLSWDAAAGLQPIHYPNYSWFKDNSQIPLRSVAEIIPSLPKERKDPELPGIEKPIHLVPRNIAIKADCPEGFPEELWDNATSDQRSLARKILVIRHHKTECDPFIKKYKEFEAQGDESTKAVMLAAFKQVVPERDGKWLKERIGVNPFDEVKVETEAEPGTKLSPMEEAMSLLSALETAKDIRKKLVRKYFNKNSPLSEDDKKKLALMVKEKCEKLGCPEEIKKMKDLLPYL